MFNHRSCNQKIYHDIDECKYNKGDEDIYHYVFKGTVMRFIIASSGLNRIPRTKSDMLSEVTQCSEISSHFGLYIKHRVFYSKQDKKTAYAPHQRSQIAIQKDFR